MKFYLILALLFGLAAGAWLAESCWMHSVHAQASGWVRLSPTEVIDFSKLTSFRYSRIRQTPEGEDRWGGDVVVGGAHIAVTPEAEDALAARLGDQVR